MIEGEEALLLTRSPRGLVRDTNCDLGAGARYRYRLGRWQWCTIQPVERQDGRQSKGRSLVVNPRAYSLETSAWRGRTWQRKDGALRACIAGFTLGGSRRCSRFARPSGAGGHCRRGD